MLHAHILFQWSNETKYFLLQHSKEKFDLRACVLTALNLYIHSEI